MNHHFPRVGGGALLLGVTILMLGTFFHPMEADPNDAAAAFAEYAADDSWIASHLGQLFGVVLMTAGLVALSWRLYWDDYRTLAPWWFVDPAYGIDSFVDPDGVVSSAVMVTP